MNVCLSNAYFSVFFVHNCEVQQFSMHCKWRRNDWVCNTSSCDVCNDNDFFIDEALQEMALATHHPNVQAKEDKHWVHARQGN